MSCSFGFIFFFPVGRGVVVGVVVVCPWGCIMNLGIVHLLGRYLTSGDANFGNNQKLHAYLPRMAKKLVIVFHAASISLRS